MKNVHRCSRKVTVILGRF